MVKVQSILLLGAGGHCKSCIDLISTIKDFSIRGVVDKDGSLLKSVLGNKVLGTDSSLQGLLDKESLALITAGQIKSPKTRIDLFELSKSFGASFPILISPVAYVSEHSLIEEGTTIFHHTVISASARIGHNCIINNKALIEHDSIIGSHCHVSTGALINGGVLVEDRCFIGSGAIIHEGVSIGSGSIIAAGQIIRKDIPSNSTIR